MGGHAPKPRHKLIAPTTFILLLPDQLKIASYVPVLGYTLGPLGALLTSLETPLDGACYVHTSMNMHEITIQTVYLTYVTGSEKRGALCANPEFWF